MYNNRPGLTSKNIFAQHRKIKTCPTHNLNTNEEFDFPLNSIFFPQHMPLTLTNHYLNAIKPIVNKKKSGGIFFRTNFRKDFEKKTCLFSNKAFQSYQKKMTNTMSFLIRLSENALRKNA